MLSTSSVGDGFLNIICVEGRELDGGDRGGGIDGYGWVLFEPILVVEACTHFY